MYKRLRRVNVIYLKTRVCRKNFKTIFSAQRSKRAQDIDFLLKMVKTNVWFKKLSAPVSIYSCGHYLQKNLFWINLLEFREEMEYSMFELNGDVSISLHSVRTPNAMQSDRYRIL